MIMDSLFHEKKVIVQNILLSFFAIAYVDVSTHIVSCHSLSSSRGLSIADADLSVG